MTHNCPDDSNQPPQMARRTFFERISLWLAGGVGLLAASAVAIPFIGYLLGPIRRKSPDWIPLGRLSDYPKGETRLAKFDNSLGTKWDGMTGHNAAYVRYLGQKENGEHDFLVFSVNCAHLGCPVTWFAQSKLFMCPCHGGVYYEDGERASGPPPRGLYHCVWQVRDGQLEIQAPHYPTLQNTERDQKA